MEIGTHLKIVKITLNIFAVYITKRIKAELPQEGILFHAQFPSLGFFINKKVGNRKN